MTRRGTLVVLSGIDSAGKSTQLDRIRTRAEDEGLSCATFWLRPGYSPALDAARRALRRLRPGALPAPGLANNRRPEAAFERGDVRVAWVAVAIADLWFQYTVTLRRLLASHDLVLCDRGLSDARIDFALRFPDLERLWHPTLRGVASSMPGVDAHFLLTIPHEEMLRRQAAKKEPFPDAPDIRDRRYASYDGLQVPRLHRIDTSTTSVEETTTRIWRVIEASRTER